ncbi:uncharacterized protein LOC128546390 isoform X2 [Mercenaria mercenaria]|uniref:uncharacterized protein LOC128546390 isoform X2 n=1 Tax=Mercenaria mercenaria TaxID=6596 RepID=UPI00234EA29E|nr:uncharacterized protein LOC128546390 isoform X2 [Mercenaria mercenaria]XP_053372861.1 uncharacterized protein LOC128546390 isoform X2 [Mercenaria mercenaria]
MMRNIYLICLTVALSSFLVKGFASRVKSTLRKLGQYDGIPDCYRVGLQKAETLRDSLDTLRSRDAFFAVILINMYSNPNCYLFIKRQGGLFNEKLNKEIQNNYPRDANSRLWIQVGNLVNKAIELLGMKTYQVVYRGCLHNPDLSRSEFSFRRITSTSMNPQVADFYTGCETFIMIEDARGLDMHRYSQIPDEAEIILQSTNIYLIEEYTRNKTEIREKLEKVLPGMQQVKLFVRLRQIHRRNFISRLIGNILRTSQ